MGPEYANVGNSKSSLFPHHNISLLNTNLCPKSPVQKLLLGNPDCRKSKKKLFLRQIHHLID
jgi:hypothetical protein